MCEIEIKNFVDEVYKVCAKTSRIFIANPSVLLKLDMKDYNTDMFFISDIHCDSNEIIEVTSEELKYKLYKFCIEHEDRIFRGEKDGMAQSRR